MNIYEVLKAVGFGNMLPGLPAELTTADDLYSTSIIVQSLESKMAANRSTRRSARLAIPAETREG